MATWKKVIVSGSVAELATVSASVGLIVGSNPTDYYSSSNNILNWFIYWII